LFAWCVRLSRLLVGFRTHFKSSHFLLLLLLLLLLHSTTAYFFEPPCMCVCGLPDVLLNLVVKRK